MANPLARIPGLAGILASREQRAAAEAQGLQQAQQQMTLRHMLEQRAQAQQAQARAAAMEQERAALGPNPSPEAALQFAIRHGQPRDILTTQTAHLDRQAAIAAKAEEARASRQAQIDAAARAVEERRAAAAEAARERRALAEEMAGRAAPAIVEIADPNDPTKSIKIDARTKQKIGDAPPKPKVERALPGPLQKQLTESAEMSDATQRFTGTFNDEYGGFKFGKVGDVVNWAKRTFGDESGQAQWWKDYELHQSQVRNKLFGSALTAPEIAAWNKSAINPGMDPKQIRLNLTRRENLETTAINRLMRGSAAGGYSRDQIEAFTGREVPGDATERNLRNKVLRFDAQGNPI